MVVAFLIFAPWILIAIAIIMIFGNGVILLTVAKNASLRQKDCLYLISGLAISDFITGIGTLPYCANMVANEYVNCTRGSILGTMVLNITGVRMNQFITLVIGIDRLYAMLYPISYRTKNHTKIALFVTVAGLLIGSIDSAM
uniref:G-protein coupled receptors family 1 profile domain-containing protein n=1 Tax=Plectus sambesii TaxID=2011161 RepID=A0A914VFL7_9BILA